MSKNNLLVITLSGRKESALKQLIDNGVRRRGIAVKVFDSKTIIDHIRKKRPKVIMIDGGLRKETLENLYTDIMNTIGRFDIHCFVVSFLQSTKLPGLRYVQDLSEIHVLRESR
jgi:hypothetical protein